MSAYASLKLERLKCKEAKHQLWARRSLNDFAVYLSPPFYRFSWHHRLLYQYLDDFAAGRRKRVLVQMPPGHGKSEGVSRNLPAYLFGKNPDARIIASSYTSDLASEMNRDVQRIIDSERYRAVFPWTRLGDSFVRDNAGKPRRNSDVFDIVNHRGCYKAAGVGQGIAGRRFDFGIIDDPIKDRETANSPTQREAMWRWYTGVFLTRQSKDASILITLTRWHEDDLVGRLLVKEPGQWDVLCLPALAEHESAHPDDPRQPGEALWPWFEDEEKLLARKQLEPRDFASLYQQNPRPEGSTEFPGEWFGESIWFDDWPDLNHRIMALDPSKGKDAKHGDYSAYIMLGVGRDGLFYIDADLDRRPAPRMVEEGYELARRFRPELFGVETNQFQELLLPDFDRMAQAHEGTLLPIVPINNYVNKIVRIRRLGPYLARGIFRFKTNSPGTRLLVQQLRDFPCGEHDDAADALEMAIRLYGELLRMEE